MTVPRVGYANKIDEPYQVWRITGRWDWRGDVRKKDHLAHLSLFFLSIANYEKVSRLSVGKDDRSNMVS